MAASYQRAVEHHEPNGATVTSAALPSPRTPAPKTGRRTLAQHPMHREKARAAAAAGGEAPIATAVFDTKHPMHVWTTPWMQALN